MKTVASKVLRKIVATPPGVGATVAVRYKDAIAANIALKATEAIARHPRRAITLEEAYGIIDLAIAFEEVGYP